MSKKDLDTPRNRARVRAWCISHNRDYENSTQLAESCADALNLYEEQFDYTIPEFIWDISNDCLPTK